MATVKVKHETTGGEWQVNEKALEFWKSRGWQPVTERPATERQQVRATSTTRKQAADNESGETKDKE